MKIIQVYIKNIFPLLLFCIISVFVFSSCEEDTVQPETYGSISGTVFDADDIKAPVSGASVTTNPPTSALLTDSNGKFKVSNIPVGNYVITVSKSGYDKGTISVSVKEGEASEASILLTKSDTENKAPYAPVNYLPADEAENQPIAVTLKWGGRDPDANDSLRYDVYLYETSSASKKLLASDVTDTTYQVSGLKYNTAYFWQIVIKDNSDASVNGDVWGFKTKPMPDNRILFVSNIDGDYDVYSTNLDDTVALQLTTNSVRDWQPRYNKDRKKIAFASDYNGDMQLYVMNYDGTGINKITSLPIAGYHNSGYGFCWAPSGDKLLYSYYDKLYQINSDGTNLKLIALAPANRNFREAEYSPLGDKITVVTTGKEAYETELYIMNSDGSNMTLFEDLPGILSSPSFSPDGKSLLFSYDASDFQSTEGRQLDARIYIRTLDNADTVNVSVNKPAGTNDLQPRFSSDGSQIIFVNAKNDGSSENEIWVTNIEGENRQKLFTGYMPDWK